MNFRSRTVEGSITNRNLLLLNVKISKSEAPPLLNEDRSSVQFSSVDFAGSFNVFKVIVSVIW